MDQIHVAPRDETMGETITCFLVFSGESSEIPGSLFGGA